MIESVFLCIYNDKNKTIDILNLYLYSIIHQEVSKQLLNNKERQHD